MISDDQLDAIQQRCNRATAGPWKSHVEGRDHTSGSNFIMTGGPDIYLTGVTIEDQDFIASARQDVPQLIDEVRRLREILRKGSNQ